MKKLCYVATIPAVVHTFLRSHIQAAAEQYEVTVVCNTADAHLLAGLKARIIFLPIERKPAPWRDLCVLVQLVCLFRRERFDLVHSMMPKTGLLAMLAAKIAGIDKRVHIFTGQVWATKQGWKRGVLKIFDKLIVLFASHLLVDSPSQRDFLIAERVLPPAKGSVLGQGSICGVNAEQFQCDALARVAVREELNIVPEHCVLLFLGRLNRDKGIVELAHAFNELATQRADVHLLLVGSEETVSFADVQTICAQYRDRLHYVDFTATPQRYMSSANIFCLPSYREGFGQVIIEAAACGIPTVATRIYGITDAVEDGKTGILCSAGDVAGLTGALSLLMANDKLRQDMGAAAQTRALALFSSEKITTALLAFYADLIAQSY